MPDSVQDYAAKITYGQDFTTHLAKAGRTITGATVTASAGTVTNVTHTATSVLWRLDTSAVAATSPYNIDVTITPTYDNGDVDPRHVTITVTNAT